MRITTRKSDDKRICFDFSEMLGLKSDLSVALALWSFACGILHADNGAGPNINVWRGTTQSFGDLGVPQRWVNLLGTVSDPDGLASLTYSLNGGQFRSLSIGPDTRRLARPGDFNAELDVTNLNQGNNSVVLNAQDQLGDTSTTTVTIHFGNNSPWPLSYSIDWGAVTNLQDVVQEVDGEWGFSSAGVRPLHMGYDRILAIGDMGWTDYEITVPVTVHAIDPASFSSPTSVGPGLGLVMRWRGHSDWGGQLGGPWQPVIGWRPQGATWWNEYFINGSGRLSLGGENGLHLLDPTYKQLSFDVTYMTRTRVQSLPSGNGGGRYRFKIWESGTPEPISWLLEGQEDADDLSSGSLLLVAHEVDATFGNVTIVPPSQFVHGIKSSVLGSGSVTLSPDMAIYPNGTIVTAKAQPVSGHTFSGWSGDLGGSDSSATFVMDGDKMITASFSPLSGGDTTGTDEFNSPLLDTGLWTFVNPLGDGTLAMTGSQLSLSLPADTDHDTWWPGGYNVARVTQRVVDEDFVIGTKFDSDLTSRYQMQGIIIEGDGDRLLRVEFHHDGRATKLFVASFENTVPTVHIFKGITATTKYMRVARTGDSWVIAHSSDGAGWIPEDPFSLNMLVHAAGLYVGNHTAAHTALIDYFHISTSRQPNQAPVFAADPIAGAGATEDAAYVGTVAGSATDVDAGDAQSYSLLSGPSWLGVAGDGTLSGTPANSHVGPNSFTIRVSDLAGRFADATLEITVVNANDDPVFTADPIAGAGATEDSAYVGTVAGSASDVDAGDALSYSLQSGPSWLGVASDGTLSGTPDNSHVGPNSFTIRVSDLAGKFDDATLEITVAPAPVGDFRDWLAENTLPADPTIDTDGDSIKNIIEYIIGGDPDNRNDLNLSPTVQLVLADPDGDLTNSEYLLLTYRRSDRAGVDPTVSIKVEWSVDFKTPWSIADDGVDDVVILPDEIVAEEGVKRVRVYIPRSLEVNGKLFARLRGDFIAPQ